MNKAENPVSLSTYLYIIGVNILKNCSSVAILSLVVTVVWNTFIKGKYHNLFGLDFQLVFFSMLILGIIVGFIGRVFADTYYARTLVIYTEISNMQKELQKFKDNGKTE